MSREELRAQRAALRVHADTLRISARALADELLAAYGEKSPEGDAGLWLVQQAERTVTALDPFERAAQ